MTKFVPTMLSAIALSSIARAEIVSCDARVLQRGGGGASGTASLDVDRMEATMTADGQSLNLVTRTQLCGVDVTESFCQIRDRSQSMTPGMHVKCFGKLPQQGGEGDIIYSRVTGNGRVQCESFNGALISRTVELTNCK